MDTKISSCFWSHPEVEAAPQEVKYAALWLLTNDRLTLCGYAEPSEKRFSFDTGLPPESMNRAFEALPETFIKTGKGYWVRNFIRWQFNGGREFARSYMSIPVVKALRGAPPEVATLALRYYPELKERFDALESESLNKPSQRPTEGQITEKRREEKRRTEQSRAEQNRVKGGAGGKANGALLPAVAPEPLRTRLLALNVIFSRQEKTAWPAREVQAVKDTGLLELSAADFDESVRVMQAFYGAKIAEADQRRYWRRTTMPTLLNNWASELDKARAWWRELEKQNEGRV